MSERYLLEYQASLRLAGNLLPFTGPADEFFTLIMTAMRYADTDNLAKLRAAFPDVYNELQARYNAPGGALTPWEEKMLDAWNEHSGDDQEGEV